jgi:signal transduction histidine kinase
MTAVIPVPPPPRARFGFRRPRQTVRLRLTLLYIGLFLASAACLLVITYFLVAGQLPQTLPVRSSGSGTSATGTQVVTGGADIATACEPASDDTPPTPEQMTDCQLAVQQQETGLLNDTLDQLLIESGVALGIMAVISVGLGWLMAGRVLRPLRTITSAARRISARSLDQRIGMTGPDDELKELGDTFDQLLGRLDASFHAQRQFVANASHELRTPLARQRTLLEVALRDPQATIATLRTACERALAAGEQQDRLIAAMLTLARGERGLDKFESFDLGDIAASALAAQHDDASARGLAVTANIETARTIGDPRLAERLVANLIDNAIRYNTGGGGVEIAVGSRDGRPFLAVTNTGPVIPPDQLGRLFQPFQRLDPARSRSGAGAGAGAANGAAAGAGNGAGGGLGLGLAIVSAIAAAHGAELRAVTRAAGGLAVEVTFPAPAPGQGGPAGVRTRALV